MHSLVRELVKIRLDVSFMSFSFFFVLFFAWALEDMISAQPRPTLHQTSSLTSIHNFAFPYRCSRRQNSGMAGNPVLAGPVAEN